MAAVVGKYAANKMLRGQMAKYQSKKPCGDQVSEPYTASKDDTHIDQFTPGPILRIYRRPSQAWQAEESQEDRPVLHP